MSDAHREKFSTLMDAIRELEDRLDGATAAEAALLAQDLAECRQELARISDGCGRGPTRNVGGSTP